MNREEIISLLQCKLREIDNKDYTGAYFNGREDLLQELLVEIDNKSTGI